MGGNFTWILGTLLEDLDVLEVLLDLAELDLGAGGEVAGGEELVAGQVGPRDQGLGKGGHGEVGGQLLEGEPEPDAVDLGHTARHPSKLGLLVHLVAVGSVDALELGSVPVKYSL